MASLRKLWLRIDPYHRGYEAGFGDAAVRVLGVPHLHPDGGHVCLYADLDGTTDGACRLPGRHGGRLPDGRTGADLPFVSYRKAAER